jgi:transcriptional regulator with XRE-family HTH domain
MVTSTTNPDNIFVDWLIKRLHEKDWTPQILASKAGVAQATISNVINRKRAAGPEFLRAIARPLDISQTDIFKKAGLIDEELVDDDEAIQEIRRLLARIDDADELSRTLDFMEAIAREAASRKKRAKKNPSQRPSKPDIAHNES